MNVAAPFSISDAIEHCRRVTRQRARNFYYGLKLAPQPQRSALYVIYAWMRHADDLADGDPMKHASRRDRIQEFRVATDRALAGRPDESDPLWVALADVARRFSIPLDDLHAMLDGQIDDLSVTHYDTFEQLRVYCYRVASTVGLICITIWGYEDPAARDLAVKRGTAFQLTNIVRDFREDYDAGRVYLPQCDFESHCLTPRDVREWADSDRCAKFLQSQCERAISYYDASTGLDELITPSCRPTLWAMTTIYRSLLDKIMDDPSRVVLGNRVRLSAWQKAMIALRARAMGRSGGSMQSGNFADRQLR